MMIDSKHIESAAQAMSEAHSIRHHDVLEKWEDIENESIKTMWLNHAEDALTDYAKRLEEGWKKSVIRRLFKRIPMSSELDRVITSDDDLYDMTPKTVKDDRPRGAALLDSVDEPTDEPTTEGEFEDMSGEDIGEQDENPEI